MLLTLLQSGGAAPGSYVLTALGGSYTFTGQQAEITYIPGSVNYTLTALGGSYSLVGQAATLTKNRYLIAQGGSYLFTGSSSNLNKNRSLTASGGSYTLNGQQVTITRVGIVWPLESDVRAGVQYGPTGVEYTGTLVDGNKFELETGRIFKPINNKVGFLI